jgi:hypothetical protein
LDIINFHVVVSGKTIPYFLYQIANARHTADDPDRIFFYCYALDKASNQAFSNCPWVVKSMPVYKYNWAYRKKTLTEWRTYLRWLLTRHPRLSGSNGHAAGLAGVARTMPHISGHHVIADVDTILLCNSWDTELCLLLEQYDLIGAPYEKIGGFSSGSTKIQTYKDFPTAVWVALKHGHPWAEVNWWPEKGNNIPINSPELSDIFRLPQGYEVIRDVGWHLCQFSYENNLKSATFDHVKPTSGQVKVLTTDNDYNEEYQWRSKAWIGHQRGSSRNPFRETSMSVKFFQTVEAAIGAPAPLEWSPSSPPKLRTRVFQYLENYFSRSGNG